MYLRESHSLYRIENKGETSNYNVPTDIPKRYISDLKVCQWTAQSWLGWRGSRPIFFPPPAHRLCISLYFHARRRCSPWVIPIQELAFRKLGIGGEHDGKEKRRRRRRTEWTKGRRGGKGGNRAWVGEVGALKHRAKCSRDKNRHDRRFALENGGLENSEEEEAKPFSENAANGVDGWATAPSRVHWKGDV